MPESLSEAWRNVFRLDALALGLGGAFTYLGYHYMPIKVPVVSSLADHVIYALRAQAPSLLLVGGAILAVGYQRIKQEAVDPLKPAKKDNDKLTVYRNFLTNTVEQYMINGPSLLILSTYLAPEQLRLIPLLVDVFVAARIAYLMGYLSPKLVRTSRSGGYILTYLPTCLIMMYNTFRLIDVVCPISGC